MITENDRRFLYAVKRSLGEFDGCAPHGSADWTAARRLLANGMIESIGHGVCFDCDNPGHQRNPTEVEAFNLTSYGRSWLEKHG